MKESLYIGLMSGTSMDAVDAVLVDLDACHLRLLEIHSQPYPPALQTRLQKAIRNEVTPDELGRLDRSVGEAFAACALALMDRANVTAPSIKAIGSHGQTVRHAPEGEEGFSLQIGDPNTIAERTGIMTVSDFRRRDIAAGGQGAPLVPAFHAWFFGSEHEPRALLNLGGIANVTLLPPSVSGSPATTHSLSITGFDIGPANTLLDSWCWQHRNLPYDNDGLWARSGNLHQPLLDSFLSDPYFSRRPPKSTGREYFNQDWLQRHLEQQPALAPADVQRTLLELTAVSVAAMPQMEPQTKVFVCGGGCRNLFLLERLRDLMPESEVTTTAEVGLAPQAVEGAAFAWLARQTLEGLPGNIPASTGARGIRILGGIYQA